MVAREKRHALSVTVSIISEEEQRMATAESRLFFYEWFRLELILMFFMVAALH